MKHLNLGLAVVPALLLLSGCMDDKYDLANIDTTTEIKVNNLVVPVQLNAITLDEATDLDDNEFIEVYTDEDGLRAYAFRRTETFESGTIRIDGFTVPAPYMGAIDINLANYSANRPSKRAFTFNGIQRLEPVSFSTHMGTSLTAIEHLGVAPAKIGMQLILNGGTGTLTVDEVKFRFPKGLDVTSTVPTGAKYYKDSGLLVVNNLTVRNGSYTDVAVNFNGIDATDEMNVSGDLFNYNTMIGVFSSSPILLDGTATATPKLTIRFDVPSIKATTLSASVEHHINSVTFDPVDLTGIPEFLADSETSLIPYNPQIYVGVDNTVGDFSGTTKLSFTSYFEKGSSQATTQGTTPGDIYVSKELRTNILLATRPGTMASNALTQYLTPTPTVYSFPLLANALNNNGQNWGLPKRIQVSASDVNVIGTKVRNLPLSEYVPGFKGSFTVFVPLAFSGGTKIVYKSEETGWNTDVLKDINIYDLNLDATVETTIPVGFGFKVTLLNDNNEVIATSNEFKVSPDSNPQPVKLSITASKDNPIKDLDGIRYVATIEQKTTDQTPLGPDQHITLTDIRITVNGAYLYEDDKD